MQTNTLEKTNIYDIINNLWFANISIENNVPEAEHTLESLDGLFPHLKIKSIKSDKNYKNTITAEILRLIGQFDNVESLTDSSLYEKYSYGLSLNNEDNERYQLACAIDGTETSLSKRFRNPPGGHIMHTIKTQNKAYKTQVMIETPNINHFLCKLTLDGKSIKIRIIRDRHVCNYHISCTEIPDENMKIIEYFFHTFTKVLTLPEVKDCCLLVNDIIKKEYDNGIDRIIDTITKVLKDIQVRMLDKHPDIRQYLQKCSIPIPDFLEKNSLFASNDDGNDTTCLCDICNLCQSCLSSIYDQNTQKDV